MIIEKDNRILRIVGIGFCTFLFFYYANYNTIILANKDLNIKDKCLIDEDKNPLGPNRCTNSNQCKGDRKCSFSKWCIG